MRLNSGDRATIWGPVPPRPSVKPPLFILHGRHASGLTGRSGRWTVDLARRYTIVGSQRSVTPDKALPLNSTRHPLLPPAFLPLSSDAKIESDRLHRRI